jgi:hypothetical protein
MKLSAIFLMITALILISCTAEKASVDQGVSALSTGSVSKIEIYHFHATAQCYSCKTVGQYAEETILTHFSEELDSGKISFASVNVDEGSNMAIAQKYGATGSSLWLGIYDDSGFHAEQNINVWYKINDKQAYMDYLKGVIEKRLSGDMS